jgi:DNA-binding FadR family transcriptional regulator
MSRVAPGPEQAVRDARRARLEFARVGRTTSDAVPGYTEGSVASGVSSSELFAGARQVVYAPIAGQSLVDLTVRRLLDVVSLGFVEIGEQLPSEPELAERLGVSAATLREALAVLRGAGLLVTRRGRGRGTVVVRDVAPPPSDEARRRLAARSVDELRDLGDYHFAIAGRSAALAAERATPAEIEVLQALVKAAANAASLEAYRRFEAQLHIGIASAARASRLIAGETAVHAELSDFLSLVARPASRLQLANEQHADILNGIGARHARRAGEAAEGHAQTVTSLLIEARSELAQAQSERTSDHFTGLRPYGSELGSVSIELPDEQLSAGPPGARRRC